MPVHSAPEWLEPVLWPRTWFASYCKNTTLDPTCVQVAAASPRPLTLPGLSGGGAGGPRRRPRWRRPAGGTRFTRFGLVVGLKSTSCWDKGFKCNSVYEKTKEEQKPANRTMDRSVREYGTLQHAAYSLPFSFFAFLSFLSYTFFSFLCFFFSESTCVCRAYA